MNPLAALISTVPFGLWASKYRQLRLPICVGYAIYTASIIGMATFQPDQSSFVSMINCSPYLESSFGILIRRWEWQLLEVSDRVSPQFSLSCLRGLILSVMYRGMLLLIFVTELFLTLFVGSNWS